MSTERSLYARLGGEEVLHKFVDVLYTFMDNTPEVSSVRSMHTQGLEHARSRLFMFLSGMLGGPPLYAQAFGHPRLRQKHMRIEIGNEERDQWMMCAQYAADQLSVPVAIREELLQTLASMADHLRNSGSDQVSYVGAVC